ncbi:hypothetical protein IWW38_003006, partial [Coemansia aciculifera]
RPEDTVYHSQPCRTITTGSTIMAIKFLCVEAAPLNIEQVFIVISALPNLRMRLNSALKAYTTRLLAFFAMQVSVACPNVAHVDIPREYLNKFGMEVVSAMAKDRAQLYFGALRRLPLITRHISPS